MTPEEAGRKDPPGFDISSVVELFIAEATLYPREKMTPDTTLFGDMGVDGDDGIEFLTLFAERFRIDMTGLNWSQHFGPEGVYPWAPFYWIILALRKGTPEEKARLEPITVGDLIRAAKSGTWLDRRG